jgi:glycosyltransferase involved in cell wall biosynthesis
MNRSAVVGRLWRGYADGRRRILRTGTAARALQVFDGLDRADVDAWESATSSSHQRYRAATSIAEGDVAVICVSKRPDRLGDVVANIARQAELDGRLSAVFVANDDGFDPDLVERSLDGVRNSRVLHPPPDTTLGAALNLAMDATSARFVAKFDDDDVYGPHHLADLLRAHSYAGAGVVGKHTYYAHIEGDDETVIRFPGREFTYSATLAGGTLVLDRDRIGDLRFDDVSIGEDRAFIAACHRRGVSTFSADRFNFVQMRHDDNTWRVAPAQFREQTRTVDSDAHQHQVHR